MKEYSEVKDSGERRQYESGMVRDRSEGKGRFDLITPFALIRLAKHYENGARKYNDRNWEQGAPLTDFYDSAMRHLTKWMLRWDDEDHLAAALWNIAAMIHFEELGREDLDNRPSYGKILADSIEIIVDEKVPEGITVMGPKEAINEILARLHDPYYTGRTSQRT